MLIFLVVALAGLFCVLLAFGNIYLALTAVIAMFLATVMLWLFERKFFSKKPMLLTLWLVLLANRGLLPRTKVDESGSLFFVEVGITLAVLAAGSLSFLSSVSQLKLRIFEGRFWLLIYTILAGLSLLWTPEPVYSGFWLLRLACVTILICVYFADADAEDCKRFFLVTLLGSLPAILLPIIGYVTGESRSLLGSHRISGFWVHPGVVTILALSAAAGSLAAILQGRGNRSRLEHIFYVVLLLLGCVSGFLAAGKTGAIGAGIAVAIMLLIGRRFRLWIGMLAIGIIGYVVYTELLRGLEVGLIAHWEAYNFERLGTVQGRLRLWAAALEVWSTSIDTTLLGRGFTSFRAVHIASVTGWDPGHAHNSFINLLVDMGIVGGFAYVAMILRATGGAIGMAIREGRAFSQTTAFVVFTTLISLLAGSFMDDVFGGTLQPTSYLFIGTLITLDRLVYLSRREPVQWPPPAEYLRARPVRPGSRPSLESPTSGG
jgi:O-antigen ligase